MAEWMAAGDGGCEMAAVPGRIAGPVRAPVEGDGYRQVFAAAADRPVALIARPLSHDYYGQIAAFQSSHAPLLGFLRNDAFDSQRAGNTCPSLFFDRETAALVAFCATKCSAVKVRGKTVLSLCPAVEIAALCVDDRYRFRGIGQSILRHVLEQAQAIRDTAGVQLVTLFAVPDAVDFYLKCGFKKLGAAGRVLSATAHYRCVPMYVKLPPAADGTTKNLQMALFA